MANNDISLNDVEQLKDALRELLSHPSDHWRDAAETPDGYFLTPLNIAERNARKLLERLK